MADARQFERVGDTLLVRAPAKLNLSLLIAGKRPDGFHEIETVMAKVDWYDEIRIEPERDCGYRRSSAKDPGRAPQDQTNLVYRAAEQILQRDRPDPRGPAHAGQEHPGRVRIGLRQQRRGSHSAGPQ